jgi:hypothetical protein
VIINGYVDESEDDTVFVLAGFVARQQKNGLNSLTFGRQRLTQNHVSDFLKLVMPCNNRRLRIETHLATCCFGTSAPLSLFFSCCLQGNRALSAHENKMLDSA